MFKFELTGVDIKTSSTEFGKIESIKLEVPKELYLEVLKEIMPKYMEVVKQIIK